MKGESKRVIREILERAIRDCTKSATELGLKARRPETSDSKALWCNETAANQSARAKALQSALDDFDATI